MQIGVQAHINGIAWSSEFRTVVQRLVLHIPHICHPDHLYIGGEQIGHVEKFQISTHDRNLKILHA